MWGWGNDGRQDNKLRGRGRMLWRCSRVFCPVSPCSSHIRKAVFPVFLHSYSFLTAGRRRKGSQHSSKSRWVKKCHRSITITKNPNNDMFLIWPNPKLVHIQCGKIQMMLNNLNQVRHGCEKTLAEQFSDYNEFICKRWDFSFKITLFHLCTPSL